MSWEDILKAPPIRNPRESEFGDNSNDNLTMPIISGLIMMYLETAL